MTKSASESPPPLLHSASSGVAWTLVGSLAHKAGTAITALVLARLLGPSKLGEYSLVQSTVMMIALYGSFRMGNVAIKHISQYQKTDPLKCARILRLALNASLLTCTAAALVMIVFSGPLAAQMLGTPHLQKDIIVGGIFLFFSTYTTILQVTLTGFKSFRASAIFSLARGILTPLICPILAYFWGVTGALAGLTICAVLLLPFLLKAIQHEITTAGLPPNVSLRESLIELPILWTFALPGFLCLILVATSNWITKTTLARVGSFHELGLFEAAAQWCTLVFFLPTILSRVMLPFLSEASHPNHLDRYSKAFAIQVRTTLLLTTPIAVGLITFAKPTMHLYGRDYVDSVHFLPLIVAAAIVRTINETIRLVYESRSRLWFGLLLYVAWAACLISITHWTIPTMGAKGFAIASLSAELVLCGLSTLAIERLILPGLIKPHLIGGLTMLALVFLATLCSHLLNEPWNYLAGLTVAIASLTPLARLIRSNQSIHQVSGLYQLFKPFRLLRRRVEGFLR